MKSALLLLLSLSVGCAASGGHAHPHEHDGGHGHTHTGAHSHGPASRPATDPVELRLQRTAAIHGGAGPFAVAGYRIGERALRALGQERGAFALQVVHKSPKAVQWSCIADGLQAATGTSPGKLNLRWEQVATPEATESRITCDGKTYRAVLAPAFVKRFKDLPREELAAAGREVAELPEAQIFKGTLE